MSPFFYFIMGTMWIVTAIVQAVEHQIFSPIFLFGGLGIFFYTTGIILVVKDRRRNQKEKD